MHNLAISFLKSSFTEDNGGNWLAQLKLMETPAPWDRGGWDMENGGTWKVMIW